MPEMNPFSGPPLESIHTTRMARVLNRTKQLRLLFEMEREFARVASALVPRTGRLEDKFRLSQHAYEAMDHARYLRERGRELAGFGVGDQVREPVRRLFTEVLHHASAPVALSGLYRVIKPAMVDGYLSYQWEADDLADWPTRKLIDEFLADEKRHAAEAAPMLAGAAADEWCQHIRFAWQSSTAALASGDSYDQSTFRWIGSAKAYHHPSVPAREGIRQNNSVFGDDPGQHLVHEGVFRDPTTDARVIRAMIYVWLMNELTAVEALATVIFDTPGLSFDGHLDLARHAWDESRHTQFGYRQLPRLGLDLGRLNIHDLPYRTYQKLTAAERYARLSCVAEPESFEVKAQIMDRVRELNDFEADMLLAFDRSDEQNHVRYGHRWVPHLMRLENVTSTPEQFVTQARTRFDSENLALRAHPEVAATLRDPTQISVDELKRMYRTGPIS
jgi:uncharacterized ferritin-like protein (DUF455 family)